MPLLSLATLPFGRHQGQPLTEVPSDYLRWVLAEVGTLSHRLRQAVSEELGRRGGDPPPPPALEVRPLRRCRQCPQAQPRITWETDRAGRNRLRADCPACGRWCDYPPCVSPFLEMAVEPGNAQKNDATRNNRTATQGVRMPVIRTPNRDPNDRTQVAATAQLDYETGGSSCPPRAPCVTFRRRELVITTP
jgi:hypothetical protein